eukprot:TRINITY_DN2266_c0_g1_i13.p2 TRINITY_DN2266_c0_g1~~TRINITY_DN2266_c0_g1_i13.p2  ORF type:complete len:142 (-),score=42.59 TRINITY_DN2266_c0_g1_i13:50-475(-)
MTTSTIIQLAADNKIDISESLKTHSVWENAIGYDPLERKVYPEQEKTKKKRNNINVGDLITRTNAASLPTCAKCKESGHLTYQCMNTFTIKDGKVVKKEMVGEPVKEPKPVVPRVKTIRKNEHKSRRHHRHRHHRHRSRSK